MQLETIKGKDENWYLIDADDQSSFQIHFSSEAKAHQFKLKLLLGTRQSPLECQETYEMIHPGPPPIFRCLDLDEVDEKEIEGMGCCQSGCAGCPDYIPR